MSETRPKHTGLSACPPASPLVLVWVLCWVVLDESTFPDVYLLSPCLVFASARCARLCALWLLACFGSRCLQSACLHAACWPLGRTNAASDHQDVL